MKPIFLFITSFFLIISCGGSSSDGDTTPIDDSPINDNPLPSDGDSPTVNIPSVAILEFPNNNEICTEAKDLTLQNTNTITFRWKGNASATNSINYEVILNDKDNNTERRLTTTQSSANVIFDIDGLRPGGEYKWQVIASKEGSDQNASSPEWTFFNAGIAEESYAPKPAIPVSPRRNEVLASSTTSVTLEWIGNDQDNDIKEYDILFGTLNGVQTSETVQNNNTSKIVPVATGTIYSWRIITRDELGNTSSSALFKFAVQ